jgi:hypothetical protein
MLIQVPSNNPEVENELRRLQYTPEERERLFPAAPPFQIAEWLQSMPPATPEELAEMEEFLQEREAEREASLLHEIGLTP